MKPYNYVGECRKWAQRICEMREKELKWSIGKVSPFYAERHPLACSILKLGEAATVDQIGALLDDHKSTLETRCDECLAPVRVGGVEIENSGNGALLCRECVAKLAVMAGLKIEENK